MVMVLIMIILIQIIIYYLRINYQPLNNNYINCERNIISNNLNNDESEQEEKPISNWFSYELVNAQRTKIKNLIILNLSFIFFSNYFF